MQEHQLEDPVYLLDLGCMARLMATWRAALPRVQPCYAVKCNDDPALLRLLACLGAGFDCASDQEVCHNHLHKCCWLVCLQLVHRQVCLQLVHRQQWHCPVAPAGLPACLAKLLSMPQTRICAAANIICFQHMALWHRNLPACAVLALACCHHLP